MQKIYQEKRNFAKTLIFNGHARAENWFIAAVEHEVHGHQIFA